MLLSSLSRRSLECDSRDAYGFALRPQHLETYREYVNIYKEEEEERSEKWKEFLEQHIWSRKQWDYQEEKSVKGRHTHLEEKALSEKENGKRPDSERNDKIVTSLAEAVNLKQVAASEEGDVTLGGIPVKFREEICSEEQSMTAEAETTELKYNAAFELEHEQTLQNEATKVGRKIATGEHFKETLDVKGSALKGQRSKEGDSVVSTGCATEKEVQLSERTKLHQDEKWGNTRPSLADIENMMNSRVKKEQSVNHEMARNGENLASIKLPESSGETKDEFEDNVCVNETLDGALHIPWEESVAGNRISSDSLFPWKEKLKNLVRGGVPKELRGEVWQAFVGVKARRVRRYYQGLLAQGTNDSESKGHESSSNVAENWARQIEKDIPRTFPGHPALKDEGRESLRRLLLAYTRHNPSVGYCQAMNFLAGLLLLLMPEENAFWTFVGIVDDYFNGYYTMEMVEAQVDQLVFEELMREGFPKLANHLDYLGVQATWISAPWFLSIFVNVLPWEGVLRVWDVLLFEGNRVMLFRTALALMELYGPALITTKDAGDAIILLQSLAASTFDSSQLVLTACMGFMTVTEETIEELREKHRPTVLGSKLYSFKNETRLLKGETKPAERFGIGCASNLEPSLSNLDEFLNTLYADSEVDSVPYLQEQVVRLKIESLRLLEEKRSAVLRAEELETALMEMVKHDNRRQLSARVEQLEKEVAELQKALANKKEQEAALLKVLMQMEQEQRLAEEVRRNAEQQAATLRYTVIVLQEKYEKAKVSLSQMRQRVVMAESMLEATTQYESGQSKAQFSAWASNSQGKSLGKKTGLLSFGLSSREDKGKLNLSDCSLGSTSKPGSPVTPPKLTITGEETSLNVQGDRAK